MNNSMLEVDLSGIIPALKFAQANLAEEELVKESSREQFRKATSEELAGLVLMMRHRGYRAVFE